MRYLDVSKKVGEAQQPKTIEVLKAEERAREIVTELVEAWGWTAEEWQDTQTRITAELEAKHHEINGETSDGYHTFNELYEHRCLLWINLCLSNPTACYWRDGHDGWPLLGMDTQFGQMSYHVPEKLLYLFKDKIAEGGPEWDKHTSQDVIERLKLYAQTTRLALKDDMNKEGNNNSDGY